VTGRRLERAVLLFDSMSVPHVFVATSSASDQIIEHFSRSATGEWSRETVASFAGDGGRAIYELSADVGPDDAFHLLVLKTQYEVDSEHFMDAWEDASLFHLTNRGGAWRRELILNYDMPYTYDMYVKSSIRQDIAVDGKGDVHVVFGEQVRGAQDPSRLRYASNASGAWVVETTMDFAPGTVDDAGWFPSLALDRNGVPNIACLYLQRVSTHSAMAATLYMLTRSGSGSWEARRVADGDDGYYGRDGRQYTGALPHLVFDRANTPHIAFSDIASTHWPGTQRLNVGNIRYAVLRGGLWEFSTVFRQSSPTGFFTASEVKGLCLLISDGTGAVHIVGEDLVLSNEHQYSSQLLEFSWTESPLLHP
jgi:hypothetical protein